MSRYIVKFMKDVVGTNGHQLEVCQGIIELEAPDEGQAVEAAKDCFCEREELAHWSIHADRIKVQPADFPS